MRIKKPIRLPGVTLLIVLALTAGATVSSHQTTISSKSLVIPAEMPGYGLIFLRATVNSSRPMWFALDSGASFPLVIDTKRAQELGLTLQGHRTLEGGAGPGTYSASFAGGVDVNIGDYELTNRTAVVFELASLAALAGRPVDGLVGSDLFKRYVVEIDYVGHKVTLYQPESYVYSGSGQSVRLDVRGDLLFVPASVQMPGHPTFQGQFLVDTGGGFVTAILNAPTALARTLPNPNHKMILDRSLLGLGGEIRLLVGRAVSISLGTVAIPNPVVYISQDKAGALASTDFDGVIGGEILKRFKVVFDCSRQRLILEPNMHYTEPFEYDMSGIRLRAEGDDLRRFRISQVLQGSPAEEAGLREGDLLDGIDGTPASRFSLDDIYQMLKRQPRDYKMSIKRGNEILSVKIKPRRLV
jgi:hypothetical protein